MLSSLDHLTEAYKGHFLLAYCPSDNNPSTTVFFIMSSSASESGADFDSTAEMSDSPGIDHNSPVGLSDPQYVSAKRRMLDAVNRLRATG